MDRDKFCPRCLENKNGGTSCPRCGLEGSLERGSPHHLAPGTILIDRYVIGPVLGQGGFGITYLARDTSLDLRLAIKEYFPIGLVGRKDPGGAVEPYSGEMAAHYAYGLERFMGEARTLARFAEHPGIVTVRDFFRANNTAYMVMQYVDGTTLNHYLLDLEKPLTPARALAIIEPICEALIDLHREGVLHRDISPGNICLDKEGRVILIDFGAARQDLEEQTRSLSIVHKAGYTPLEQYGERGKQGPWTDVYALTATLYRALTGQAPPPALDRLGQDPLKRPSHLHPGLGTSLDPVLLKGLALEQTERYQNVEEFRQALRGRLYRENRKNSKEPEEGKKPGPRPKTLYRPLAAALLLGALFLLFWASDYYPWREDSLDPVFEEENAQGTVRESLFGAWKTREDVSPVYYQFMPGNTVNVAVPAGQYRYTTAYQVLEQYNGPAYLYLFRADLSTWEVLKVHPGPEPGTKLLMDTHSGMETLLTRIDEREFRAAAGPLQLED